MFYIKFYSTFISDSSCGDLYVLFIPSEFHLNPYVERGCKFDDFLPWTNRILQLTLWLCWQNKNEIKQRQHVLMTSMGIVTYIWLIQAFTIYQLTQPYPN